MAETARVATQLRHAFTGDPWHGSPIRDILAGVTAEQANARPLASAHTIWELVLHIDVYLIAAYEVTQGIPMPIIYGTERDWPKVTGEWANATDQLFQDAERLAKAIDQFEDHRLGDTVPGRDYDSYYLFHGIVQHSLYHAGQIAMLRTSLT